MKNLKWKQRVSYWLDNQLAKGPLVLIGWLGLVTFLLVLLSTFAALLFKVQPADTGLKEVFWDILFQALTPNPFDVTAPGLFLLIMLFITLLSLFMVSILIGILTTGIESRLNALRRGRSKVLEKNHTIILGWSAQVFTIISELIQANENRKGGAVIVILAERDKVEMEDAIRVRIPNFKNTRLICRSGTPVDLDDLDIVSPHTARSIIVLPPENDNPDSYVIKTVLAIVKNPNRRPQPYHIVTQLEVEHNLAVVKMIGSADIVHAILMGDQVARIVAQTSRQSGLSVIYTDLLNFSGGEIYLQPAQELAGMTYGEALLALPDSSLIGLRFANGVLKLNPGVDTRISGGDQIIAISEDEDAIKIAKPRRLPISAEQILPPKSTSSKVPEKGLILGWNSKAPLIIKELDYYVAPGSELLVVSEKIVEPEIKAGCSAFQNQTVTFLQEDVIDRQVLDRLNAAEFQHIIVLAYEDMDEQEADAETMVTLLHLRDILEHKGRRCAIVSEILDLRNRRLAEVTKVDDFIVSDHLISLMLAQFSENSERFHIFAELFDSNGTELYFKPVGDYVDVSKPVSYYTLVESARRRGETAAGYRITSEMNDPSRSYGVYTNPLKAGLVTFSEADKVVVLAERQ